jgi:hypothetical protein
MRDDWTRHLKKRLWPSKFFRIMDVAVDSLSWPIEKVDEWLRRWRDHVERERFTKFGKFLAIVSRLYKRTVRAWKFDYFQWRSIPEPLRCDVCKKPAKGVYASQWAPVSWSLCQECLDAGREPVTREQFQQETKAAT